MITYWSNGEGGEGMGGGGSFGRKGGNLAYSCPVDHVRWLGRVSRAIRWYMSHYGRALQSKVTAGDQKGNSILRRSCRSRRRSKRDGMLGGARPDEIGWRGETKGPPACVSVRQSLRRRQYFYRAGKNILGDGFSSVESEWRSKRFFFHHVKRFFFHHVKYA